MNLRKAANGRMCQVRIPGVCNRDPETTVLAHYRLNTGMGRKPHDLCGAWCCSSCHDEIDRRTNISALSPDELRIAHANGVMRTIEILASENIV